MVRERRESQIIALRDVDTESVFEATRNCRKPFFDTRTNKVSDENGKKRLVPGPACLRLNLFNNLCQRSIALLLAPLEKLIVEQRSVKFGLH